MTEAAAPAGDIPALSITGIKVDPTAAATPEAEGMTTLTMMVTAVQTGIKKIPNPRIGLDKRATRC